MTYRSKSFIVTAIIKTNMKIAPPIVTTFSIDAGNGLRRIASMAFKTNLPPSNAGIGIKFMMPKFKDSIAIKAKIPKNPVLAAVDVCLAIDTGPPSLSKLNPPEKR